ncbi:MAG: MptD family putative ECF transporter S component [Bacteroidales bacterium]|nr:MptD family putative ECF transporter S component [Bacteroidales bacterium]
MDKKLTFKKVTIIILIAVAYLATFILGAASGAIHPACYAYVGAVLPLLTAFIYLYTCTLIPRFGAATFLNGFILLLFLIVGEADLFCAIGMVVLTALSEILRKAKEYDTKNGVRWSFVPFAFSFFTYISHWWTDTEGSLAAAVEEMPAGYDQLMLPVIENIPMMIVALLLTIPVAILAMRLAERAMKKSTVKLK